MHRTRPSTFSIVAFDSKTKDLGVAVESKFVAVGAVVPFAAARVGAVATQAYANTAYGPDALAMLKRGVAPKDVVKRLVTGDKDAAQRQVGVVDARGRAASYTGKECFPWAGHVVGRNFAAQGNILAGEEVLKALARAFEMTQGDLPVRLLAALSAGQRAGGDKRGQQSAAILVVRHGGGYAGFNDRWIDIRVDDHPAPIEELIRIFNVYDLTLLNREDPKDVVVLKPDVVRLEDDDILWIFAGEQGEIVHVENANELFDRGGMVIDADVNPPVVEACVTTLVPDDEDRCALLAP